MTRAKKNETVQEYYSLDPILKKDSVYNIIFGERSNGKTYAVLNYALKNYFAGKGKFAILRRYGMDITASKIKTFFAPFFTGNENLIEKYSCGLYDRIVTRSGYFYLAKYDETLDKIITENDYIGVALSLADVEHFKSTSYPEITTIFFDEFISRTGYLQDEFILFMNVLSTIIRERKNVKIFMCGNTVNKYNPYFEEMGLKNATRMAQGTIDVYSYANSALTTAVEYCGNIQKASNVYFAFDNPKLNMITGGIWELDIYPHIPTNYTRNDVILTFYVEFKQHILSCDVVQTETDLFIYCHRKTTPIKDRDSEIVYSLIRDSNPLHFQIMSSKDTRKVNRKIVELINNKKLFFQNNDIGDIFFNYLKECQNIGI